MELYRARVEAHLEKWIASLPDHSLYGPIAYLLGLPAKRIRPVLTLMACELFGAEPEQALDEAIGIELFHNFTLMHDDIMDRSPLRRGQPTVHEKWDANTAILSGDALFVKAYALMGSDPAVLTVFNRYALAVCEGQQMDMEYESRTDVSLDEYQEMIRRKTAVLLSCALQVGAIKANASIDHQQHIGAFGEHLGLAFQIQDDLLDTYGDQQVVGKRIGGDLKAGKKTWILIRALEQSKQVGDKLLNQQLELDPEQRNVDLMMNVLDTFNIREQAIIELERHHASAMSALDSIDTTEACKQPLRELAVSLLARTS